MSDTREYCVHGNLVCVTTPDGRVAHGRAAIRYLTPEQVREARARCRHSFAQTPNGIICVDCGMPSSAADARPTPGHTPGPWKVVGRTSRYHDLGDTTDYALAVETDDAAACEIALVYTGDVASDQAEADARLIAASPDLLAACRAAFDYLDHAPVGPADGLLPQLAAAILKARGEEAASG